MSQENHIQANDLRVFGEMISLHVTLATLAIVFLFLIPITLGMIFIMIAIVAVLVKVRQGQLLGQAVKVTPDQFPDTYAVARESADRLDMSLPDVFIVQNPVINAFAIGFLGRKSVVLHSATVESMSPDELRAILGHELTHIKCDHTNWLALTSVKDQVKVPVISDVLGVVFLYWSRKAEYTSDRGGLVASRDLNASVSALAKVAVGAKLYENMNLDKLFDQKHEVDRDDLAKLAELLGSHPYIVKRIHELRAFHDSRPYERLTGSRDSRSDDNSVSDKAERSQKKAKGGKEPEAEKKSFAGKKDNSLVDQISFIAIDTFTFECRDCGYSAEVNKEKLPKGAKKVRGKCPKCKKSQIMNVH